jgi:hypothetical protein
VVQVSSAGIRGNDCSGTRAATPDNSGGRCPEKICSLFNSAMGEDSRLLVIRLLTEGL